MKDDIQIEWTATRRRRKAVCIEPARRDPPCAWTLRISLAGS